MKRSRRLGTVTKLANRRRDEAARLLHASGRNLEMHKASQQLLSESQRAHQGTLEKTLDGGGPAYRLKLLMDSIQALETGLQQLSTKIVKAEADRSVKLERWVETRARAQALDAVTERHRQTERRAEQRKHDAEVDDQSARRALERPRD